MLGSAVYDVLKDRHHLVITARNKEKIKLLEDRYGETRQHTVVEFNVTRLYDNFLQKKGSPSDYLSSFLKETGDVDYVINAIGITIPSSLENPAITFFVNGALPHLLTNVFGDRLIHITTDCVYNGKEGFPYDENSPKTPVDIYGVSKSLGEPTNCLTLRTSIIGPEIDDGGTGLLGWFLQQKNKTITGFANHYWNGITTKQFGKICDHIIQNRDAFPKTGLYHIFSTSVSKYDMLRAFEEKYRIGSTINPEYENKLNRTLATTHNFNNQLKIPSFEEMLKEL